MPVQLPPTAACLKGLWMNSGQLSEELVIVASIGIAFGVYWPLGVLLLIAWIVSLHRRVVIDLEALHIAELEDEMRKLRIC